jgi:hypothetical protein
MLKDLEQQISTAAEEGIQQARGGGGTDNSSGSGSGMSSASSQASSGSAVSTVIKEGALLILDIAGKRHRRSFQLVKKPPSRDEDSTTQLVLLAFKADQNPLKLEPAPVGAAENASST